jgi:hypothetical protein
MEMLHAVGVLPWPGTDFTDSWISLCPFHARVIVWAGDIPSFTSVEGD